MQRELIIDSAGDQAVSPCKSPRSAVRHAQNLPIDETALADPGRAA
jgi:hypothetical protein